MRGHAPSSLGVIACLWLAACGGTSARSHSAAPSPPRSPVATHSPATPTPSAAQATLSGCPAPVPFDQLRVLHRFSTDTDDLAVDGTGHIWVSSRAAGRIDELSATGTLLASFVDANQPEGLVPLSDGSVVVAEQGPNRLDLLDPSTGRLTPMLAIPNPTGGPGIDGIALSGDGGHLLVPDSPSGRLLQVPIGGGGATVLATGLGRPVDAGQLADGTVVVASEATPGLLAVSGASVRALGRLSDLDEAIPYRGLVYVTGLSSGEVLAVDPSSGASRVLVTGAPSPQGLTVAPGGDLLLVDSTRRVLVEAPTCS